MIPLDTTSVYNLNGCNCTGTICSGYGCYRGRTDVVMIGGFDNTPRWAKEIEMASRKPEKPWIAMKQPDKSFRARPDVRRHTRWR
jgi:hypothetical protein